MVSQKKAWLILIIIVLFSGIIRLINLNALPLNWDEVSHGYNAYSLLFTGRDQWNQAFPILNFRAYGDYPTTLNLYMTVLPIKIFGPTDFGLRLSHALIGILSVVLAYIGAYRWQKNRLLALFAAFLVAGQPWTFFPSRAVFQSNWAVFLLFLGLALYFSKKMLPAILIWGLALFAYHNTRIFIPLLTLYLLLQKRVRSNKLILAVLVSVLVFSAGILWFSQSRARGNWVGILDSGAIAYLEQQRNISTFPALITKLLFNRPVFMLTNIGRNYLGYFSPQYLFFTGGTQYQYSLPGFGVLNPVLLPFFYYGIYSLWRRRQWFLLAWLVLSPLPAAITRDQSAVIRSTTMIPAVIFSISLGLITFISFLNKRHLIYIFPVLIMIFFYFTYTYICSYFVKYPIRYASSWQYGNRQMVNLVKSNFTQYDQIIITKRYGEPHEYVLWYWPWNPKDYQADSSLKWDFHDNWYWINAFSRLRFVNDWEIRDMVKVLPKGKKYLIISSADSRPEGAKIGQINYPDGSTAYVITAI